MHVLLHEVLARVGAIYLGIGLGRTLCHAFAEGEIENSVDDVLNWLGAGWSRTIVRRDAAPVRFWALVVTQIVSLAACVFVAIRGWST